MASKSDLLVRVRYQNPLPPPPYPPKLLNIPTDPKRYAKVEFTQPLSNETPLPMIVDAECGMPLDLSLFDELWDGSNAGTGQDSQLCPTAASAPPIDPRDLFMLEGFTGPTSGGLTGAPVNVSWLRKTEYIARDSGKTAAAAAEAKQHTNEIPIDVSRAAQIRSIEESFPSANSWDPNDPVDLSTLKHPTKRNVTAVDTFEILPDADLWANEYDIFRFSERPGERSLEVPDPRLDCAILRPMESDGDHFLAYYLTDLDEEAEQFKESRHQQAAQDDMDKLLPPDEDEERTDKKPTAFRWIRDYETAKVDRSVSNEFLLVLDDGTMGHSGGSTLREGKGAYYTAIGRKITLKKKRQNKNDSDYAAKWDIIQLSHSTFTQEDIEEREEVLAEVTDPQWAFRVAPDAEGEEDDGEGDLYDTAVGHHHSSMNGMNGSNGRLTDHY